MEATDGSRTGILYGRRGGQWSQVGRVRGWSLVCPNPEVGSFCRRGKLPSRAREIDILLVSDNLRCPGVTTFQSSLFGFSRLQCVGEDLGFCCTSCATFGEASRALYCATELPSFVMIPDQACPQSPSTVSTRRVTPQGLCGHSRGGREAILQLNHNSLSKPVERWRWRIPFSTDDAKVERSGKEPKSSGVQAWISRHPLHLRPRRLFRDVPNSEVAHDGRNL